MYTLFLIFLIYSEMPKNKYSLWGYVRLFFIFNSNEIHISQYSYHTFSY